MRDIIDMHGASGALYRFNLAKDGRPLSPMGGSFLYVRETAGEPEILHLGEVQNLQNQARDEWPQAVKAHGATHLFTRLNVTERTRQQECADILAASRPPMTPPVAEVA